MWNNGPIELFHGTRLQDSHSILSRIDFSRSRSVLDFGPGFYTTTNARQARYWARFVAERRGGQPAVVHFLVPRDQLASLDVLTFVRGDRMAGDYWEFVSHCRAKTVRHGGTDHARVSAGGWYDVVYGPVMSNLGNRYVHPNFDQVSFHTGQAADILDDSEKGVSWWE